jgi:hypothetical protein
MPRDVAPVERVRKARASADRHLVALAGKRAGVVDRLRTVHPAILIGASVAAGLVIARLFQARPARRAARAVTSDAPLAALAGYMQTFVWRKVAREARRWWLGHVRREEFEAPRAAAEPLPVQPKDYAE